MSAEPYGRRWAGEPTRPVADYFDKLMSALEAEAPLDHHAASLRFDELACMRRSLAVAAAGRSGAHSKPAAPRRGPSGACTAAIANVFDRSGNQQQNLVQAAAAAPHYRMGPPQALSVADEQLSLPPKSRAELALRRRALWADAGERAACELLGRWNGEFQRLIEEAPPSQPEDLSLIDGEVAANHQAAAKSPAVDGNVVSAAVAAAVADTASGSARVGANGASGGAVSAAAQGAIAGLAQCRAELAAERAVASADREDRMTRGGTASSSSKSQAGHDDAATQAAATAATAACVAAERAAQSAQAAAKSVAQAAAAAGVDQHSSRTGAERRGAAGWTAAWQGNGAKEPGRPPARRAAAAAAAELGYVAEVMRPHGAARTATPPSWSAPYLPPSPSREGKRGVASAAAEAMRAPSRFTAGGAPLMPAAAAAEKVRGERASLEVAHVPSTAAAAAAACAPHAAWPARPRRRRWFKTVGVVMSKRGGRESHRFVDITNGVSEFHFGRTTTRYDGSLLVGPAVPAHGFEVHESVHAALIAPFPPDSRHVHAPRALLEVMVGGQPMMVDGRIFFVQLTPVRLLADPDKYAALHRELFGDEYYFPAPPLVTVPDEGAIVAAKAAEMVRAAEAQLAAAKAEVAKVEANAVETVTDVPVPDALSAAASALARSARTAAPPTAVAAPAPPAVSAVGPISAALSAMLAATVYDEGGVLVDLTDDLQR